MDTKLLENIWKMDESLKKGKRQRKRRQFADWKDISNYPSYTHFQIPYHIQCRERYINKRKMYEDRFQSEIAELVEQQSGAYEAARFYRIMSISTLWPPLHSGRQIILFQRNFFRHNKEQQKRLNLLMMGDVV